MNATSVYLDALFGAEPAGGLIEVRYRLPDGRRGMGQAWHPVEEKASLPRLIASLALTSDTFIGVAPRTRRVGGREAVRRAHALWVDCDEPAAIAALGRFEPAPPIVVRSGRGRHAYWPLFPPASPDEVEVANRKLAQAVGSDPRVADAARILRPPGTYNFKTNPPAPVTLAQLDLAFFELDDVVSHLPDPPRAEPQTRAIPPAGFDEADPLLSVPPRIYIEALTGVEVGRDGKIACPFHPDRTPSLHVYEQPEQGWTCFGCGAGGTAIDFAARLWNIEPRGSGFHEIRRRLLDTLLGAVAA